MTLRSLSASESCLGVAGGGKGDSGLGEEDTHSKEFMSWRLRQKAATCSVLCKKGGEKQPKKDERFKGKSDKILHKRKRQCSQRWEPQTLGSRCHFLPTVVHTSMTVQQLSLERGSEAALKKKKIICTNLVYFQSVITMTFHLPLTHIALFPGVFLLLMDRWCNDSALSQNQNIHTTVSVHIQYGLPW